TCTSSLSLFGGQSFSSSGGTGTINFITPASNCSWTVGAVSPWISLTSPSSGIGNGTVTFRVLPNTGPARSATITVAGFSFTIEQQAASVTGLSLIGAMPHIAARDVWTTTFTFVNKTASAAIARLSMFGDPSGDLSLPLLFPLTNSSTLMASS